MKKAATHPTGNGHINRYEYTKKPRYIKSRAVKMLESIEKAGGLYVVARSFAEFRDWYNETFET